MKSLAQQDTQSLHRVRDRLVAQRTGLIDHTRGLLAEYGIVHPTGAALFARRAREGLAEVSLSPMAREAFEGLQGGLDALRARIDRIDERLVAIFREDDVGRRITQVPGIGPVTAMALVASIGDARQFRTGRELAAWIGLVPASTPRAASRAWEASGEGRATICGACRSTAPVPSRCAWRRRPTAGRAGPMVIDRRGLDKGLVAMADKTARITWAMLIREEEHRPA